MDECIGTTGTIACISTEGINLKESIWSFPPKSLVKVGFSSSLEMINYMKRGGHVVALTYKSEHGAYYRIKNGVLEISFIILPDMWSKSIGTIEKIQANQFYDISLYAKRKYS